MSHITSRISRERFIIRFRVGYIIALLTLSFVCLPDLSRSDPLDWSFATAGVKAYFTTISGRMGFNQQITGNGTLNDLQDDLGLPVNNRTFEIDLSVRPLEHHRLRMFGRIPESYRGNTRPLRELRTRNAIYPAGQPISSSLQTAMFAFGYDLDLLIGPRWFGGLHAEARYLDLKMRIGNDATGNEDTLQLDEVIPCLGTHMTTRLPFGLGFIIPGSKFGFTGSLTYGITPNFINYVDLKLGGSLLGGIVKAPMFFDLQAGYAHESIFHYQENAAGRTMELKRDGVYVSLEFAY